MASSNLAELFRAATEDRIPRDPEGCLRCDGPLRGRVMFCAYCESALTDVRQSKERNEL